MSNKFLIAAALVKIAKTNGNNTNYNNSTPSMKIREIKNTVFSPISGLRWCKSMCPLIRRAHLLESCAILVLFSKIYYFYIYI